MTHTERKARELAYILNLTKEVESLSETEAKIVKIIENRMKEFAKTITVNGNSCDNAQF